MVAITVAAFEDLVTEALADIPEGLRGRIDNVAVLVDAASPPGALFGLYEGVPLTERLNGYSGVAPDRITVFMGTLCAAADTVEDLARLVRTTVIHEIGHHFGIDDERLDELGWA